MKRELSMIVIRNMTDEQRDAVEIAKRETGYATASQAVMAATCSFSRMARITKQLQEENQRLKKEIRILKKCATQVLEAGDRIRTVITGNGEGDDRTTDPPERKTESC